MQLIPGTTQVVLADDRLISRECLKHGDLALPWEPLNHPEVRSRLGPDHLMVDVGAFIGDTAIHFVRAGNPVVAYESQPDAYACLSHNLADHARVVQACVGDGSRLAPQSRKPIDGNLGSRSSWPPDREHVGGPSVRLDADLDKCPSIVKIDVEGCEPYVLAGMSGIMSGIRSARRPLIIIEVNRDALDDHEFTEWDVLRPLLKHNYALHPMGCGRVGSRDPWDVLAVPLEVEPWTK